MKKDCRFCLNNARCHRHAMLDRGAWVAAYKNTIEFVILLKL